MDKGYLAHLLKPYRKRAGVTRLKCPHPDYKDAWVEVPGEWLLLHQGKYKEAYDAVEKEHGPIIAELAGALALVEDFHLPPLNDELTNLAEVPTTVLAWLREAVVQDYMRSWNFDPKAFAPSSTTSKKRKRRRSGSKGAKNTEASEPSSEKAEA